MTDATINELTRFALVGFVAYRLGWSRGARGMAAAVHGRAFGIRAHVRDWWHARQHRGEPPQGFVQVMPEELARRLADMSAGPRPAPAPQPTEKQGPYL